MTGFVLLVMLPIAVVLIYIYYRFLRTLRDVLRQVDELNRTMQPELVWLNFIPIFNLVWVFVTVIKVRDSVRAEFAYRGLRPDGGFGFGVGMAFAVANVISEIYVPSEQSLNEAAIVALTVISWVAGTALFICWLFYWRTAALLRDVLSVAIPAPGSVASPEYPVYEPAPWQTPPERQADPATEGEQRTQPTGQPAAGELAPWLGARSSQEQPAPWLAAQQTRVSTIYCLSCGAAGEPIGGMCRACGQLLTSSATNGQREAGSGSAMGTGGPMLGVGYAPDAGQTANAGAVGESVSRRESEPTPVAGSSTCLHCGATYRTEASYCWSCGRAAPG